jgi:disulfide bond formation protein DsbB
VLNELDETLSTWHLEIIFLLTAAATTGSLYVSNVLDWQVCQICWFQRVLMYPLPLIVAGAVFSDVRRVKYSVLPLSVLGAFTSLYHFLSIATDPTQSCGFILPCSLTNQLYIGIGLMPRTLPFSALLVFTAVSLLVWRYG